jgi:hypothetical protein
VSRLIGPGDRLVYRVSATGALYSGQAMPVKFYTDAGLTIPANILTEAGAVISNSTVITDAYGQVPLIQFPDGVDTLYASAAGGAAWPVYARADDRLDTLAAAVAALQAARDPLVVAQLGSLLTTGEETFSRVNRTDSNNLTSGAMQLIYFTARKTESTSQLRLISGGTGTATVTLGRIGLYAIDGTGAGTLIAATANDTALLSATNTVYTKSWAAPANKVAGQRYALGTLIIGATAGSVTGMTTSAFASEMAMAPRTAGRLNSQSDLPANFTDAALATAFFYPYMAVLP